MTTGINTTNTSLSQAMGQLQGLFASTPGLANLVAGGATGATTPAAGATNGATAPAANTGTSLTETMGRTHDGQTVKITKDASGRYAIMPAPGRSVRVQELHQQTGQPTGQILLFDARGVQTRNFELAAASPISNVNLDNRVGIASGITNLSRIVSARHERLKALQDALAKDSNETGSTNQVDIQQLVQEQQVTEHLSNLNHKIYESVQNAITPWLR